jgi:hypothetical protein
MNEPTTSLRDAIEAAIEEPEQPNQQPQAAPEPAPAAEPQNAAAESAEPAAEPAGDQPGLTELAEGVDNQDVQQQPRDEQGKFAKQDGIQPGPKSGPKAQQPERPPASWKPDAREHWGQLPENVRAEISRRETEVQRTLQETAEARKTAEAVMRTIAPYEAFIKAENSNPLQAIDNLMATAAKLRTGTAPELATMVAGIVQQFGVGRFGASFIEALDTRPRSTRCSIKSSPPCSSC